MVRQICCLSYIHVGHINDVCTLVEQGGDSFYSKLQLHLSTPSNIHCSYMFVTQTWCYFRLQLKFTTVASYFKNVALYVSLLQSEKKDIQRVAIAKHLYFVFVVYFHQNLDVYLFWYKYSYQIWCAAPAKNRVLYVTR